MSEFRIGDNNYFFNQTVSATSQDAAFPVSNLADYSLAKYWRSSLLGTFVITASVNDRLQYRDNGFVTRTCSLTPGTYTAQTLCDHIATVMSAFADTFAVTYSQFDSGKFRIVNTMGNDFQLLFASGSQVARSVAPTIGFPATDVSGSIEYTGSTIAIHTVERVIVDLGASTQIDSFAAIWQKSTGPKFSGSAVVRLKASDTANWASPSVNVLLAYDEDHNLMTHFFSSPQSYRYWAVEIVDPTNPDLYVELPKLFLAKATQLTQVPSIGLGLSTKDRSESMQTPYGHRYSNQYPKLRTLDFKYLSLSADDLATIESIFDAVGSTVPVFISLDPLGSLYEDNRFFMFGYFAPELKRTHSFYTFWDTGLVLEEAQ